LDHQAKKWKKTQKKKRWKKTHKKEKITQKNIR